MYKISELDMIAKVRVYMHDADSNDYYTEWDVEECEALENTSSYEIEENTERSDIEKIVREMIADHVNTVTANNPVYNMNMDVYDSNNNLLETFEELELEWSCHVDLYEDIELTLDSYELEKID